MPNKVDKVPLLACKPPVENPWQRSLITHLSNNKEKQCFNTGISSIIILGIYIYMSVHLCKGINYQILRDWLCCFVLRFSYTGVNNIKSNQFLLLIILINNMFLFWGLQPTNWDIFLMHYNMASQQLMDVFLWIKALVMTAAEFCLRIWCYGTINTKSV